MARSINEIYNQIVATKNTYLPALTTTSKASVFGLLAYCYAVCVHYVETLLDAHKAEVQQLLDTRQPATRSWYASKVPEFQLGDAVDGTGHYPVTDLAKRIVSRVAVKETTAGVLVIKAAKGTVGNEEALSPAEKLQLDAYIDEIKYAGTRTEIISLNGDLLNIEANVYYDPIYTLSDIQTRVESALREFMSTLPFDGIVKRNELIEKIRDVVGVHDIDFTLLEGQAGSVSIPITRNYEMVSGYVKENVTDYPFATSIQYIPEQ